MRPVFAIASAVVADAIRRKVVWVVLVFAALLAFAVPSLPTYGSDVVSAVYREVALALMFTAALIVGLALATTRIPGEVERRTVYNVLTRDVRRWHYVGGTWLGMFGVVGIVVVAFSGIAIATGAFVYQESMLVMLEGALGIWCETGIVMAVAILLSTRFGTVTSAVGALAFLFIGHSVPSLLGVGPHASTPWWLPSLESFNVINAVAHGSGVGVVYLVAMVGFFAVLAVLLLLLASLSFAGRDL